MNINIKATGLELTPPIKEFIKEKIGSLHKFIQKLDPDNQILAEVEIARTTTHHHKGDVFHAEVNLTLPGKMLRAEAEDFDIRVATNKVKDKIQREIEKYKETR